ncbi:MAG TPA: hypothetical protein VEY95_17885 [Azospirillaceae bacterium]|nr:hypothetical protein [Azospirillaceae bacterium]
MAMIPAGMEQVAAELYNRIVEAIRGDDPTDPDVRETALTLSAQVLAAETGANLTPRDILEVLPDQGWGTGAAGGPPPARLREAG